MDPITLISLILTIILKLPEIIAAIKAVWEKIHGIVPLAQRPRVYGQLHAVLHECKDCEAPEAKAKLEAFSDELEQTYAQVAI